MSWIQFNDTFDNFVKAGKNLPGVKIEIVENGRRKIILIGDINMQGSAEIGGRPFSDKAIVCRYEYIWGRFNDTP